MLIVGGMNHQHKGHDTVASQRSSAGQHIYTALRTRFKNGIAPSIRQLLLTNLRIFHFILALIHHQVQSHEAVAAVDGVTGEEEITALATALKDRIAPGIRKILLTDGLIFLQVESGIDGDGKIDDAVATVNGKAVELIGRIHAAHLQGGVAPHCRKLVLTEFQSFELFHGVMHGKIQNDHAIALKFSGSVERIHINARLRVGLSVPFHAVANGHHRRVGHHEAVGREGDGAGQRAGVGGVADGLHIQVVGLLTDQFSKIENGIVMVDGNSF